MSVSGDQTSVDGKKQEVSKEQEILKELCSSNGLTLSRLSHEGPQQESLHMFFSGFPYIYGLQYFPNVRLVQIMGQTLTSMNGLQHCQLLKELWISDCQLTRIEGLENCCRLRKLFLYSNKIEKIEHLESVPELQTLWLNDNKIQNIEGISHLKYLREINFAENRITKIGQTLNNLQYLERLELSGNPLTCYRDLTNLSQLSSLRELGLKSPEYCSSPVGHLCNYSTHLLYHLPQLTYLDKQDVNSRPLQDVIKATVEKKKMYYRMKVKTVKRNLSDVISCLASILDGLQSGPKDRIRALAFMVKEIDREVRDLKEGEEEAEGHGSGTESEKDARQAQERSLIEQLQNKRELLCDQVKSWEAKCLRLEQFYEEAVNRMRQAASLTNHRLHLELQTGGNIRFEDGNPDDVWFASCHDLVLSRFCATDYRDYGILGLRIKRVTRLHNRVLRMHFENHMAELVDEEEPNITAPGSAGGTNSAQQSTPRLSPSKKLLEYLFWVWNPELPGGLNEHQRILEDGFLDPETYKKLTKDAAVPLTNSLSLADRLRIAYELKHAKDKDPDDPCPFRHGQLIVAKVFLGKTQQYLPSKPIDQAFFPNVDTVYKPREESAAKSESSSPEPDLSSDSDSDSEESVGSDESIADESQDMDTSGTSETGLPKCECSARQCEWFAFNHKLVVPEYIINFEYLTRSQPSSPFANCGDLLLDGKGDVPEPDVQDHPSDNDVLNLPPTIKQRPRHVQISDEMLLKTTRATCLNNIRVLNLHGNGLSKLRNLSNMPQLRRLIISFNELTRLDDLCNLNLEYVDASFNKLTSLEGLKNLNKLLYLDLSWNQLFSTRDDISILRKHASNLQSLDLRNNNWQKPSGLRLRTIGRIRSLTKLNGIAVTEEEATAALRMAAGSRISQVSLLAHSRMDPHRPRSLSLNSYAQILTQSSRWKPDRAGDSDNAWYSKVTTLNLDGQHISKVSNLERLENLKWASFNNNDITKIEGLETCSNLEELSFEDNCITKIEGLARLSKLESLSLAHNYISTLEGSCLDKLVALKHLSLESNGLTSMAGLQRLTALTELYLGNNLIANVREVFYLKNLPQLLILDLHGNAVVGSTDSYRLFIIYHLKSLKALDGVAIESTEGSQARDTFGGRLTPDFVAERLGHANFTDIRELDFPQCSIRTVDLGNGEQFQHLRSMNLENNNLTSFSGLIYLKHLRVLCLNHNHIECVVPRSKAQPPQPRTRYPGGPPPLVPTIDPYNPDSYTPLLENLEVLHLGYNGIKDMAGLQLSRLISLKALFLQGNEISKVEGLEGLQELRELVLDRNKIKGLSEYSFANQWQLQELHLEENRVRDLSHLASLENLQRLFLGMNRIQDISELEKLEGMANLIELSVVSNAVARRLLHRPMLVYRMPQLLVIDGIPVSEEERSKADLYFMEQQPTLQMTTTVEATLPGIGHYKTQIPVKVTNMQLLSGPFGPYTDKTFGGTLHFSEDIIQSEVQKGGGRKRNQGGSMSGNNGTPTKLSGTMSYQHGGSYPSSGSGTMASRSQHQLSQVPYVPYQPTSQDYITHTESMSRMNKNNRR